MYSLAQMAAWEAAGVRFPFGRPVLGCEPVADAQRPLFLLGALPERSSCQVAATARRTATLYSAGANDVLWFAPQDSALWLYLHLSAMPAKAHWPINSSLSCKPLSRRSG